MSYASRLVQMSRPATAPSAGLAVAPITEVHEEIEAPAPSATPTRPSAPAESRSMPARSETIEHRVERERVVQDRMITPEVTIVEAVVPARAAPVERTLAWREEDPSGDPLERVEGSEDLRTLLRAVRAWTAEPVPPRPAPPAPIEITNVTTNLTTEAHHTSMVPSQVEPSPEVRVEQSTQVSIGNVMITLEDAPARREAVRPQRPRLGETASRLARHFVRDR